MFFLNTFTQNSILSFSDGQKSTIDKPIRNISDKGISGLSVEYIFSTADIQTLNQQVNEDKSAEFQLINIPGFSHLQTPGQAALPSHIEMIALPKGATYQIEIKSITKELHKGYHIYPAREPARDTEGAKEPPFVYDEDYYKTNSFFPAHPVEVIEAIEIRGMKFLLLQICPVQYNPATSEIYTYSQIKFSVVFSGASSFLDYKNHSKTFVNSLISIPINDAGFNQDFQAYLSGNTISQAHYISTDYLIITQDAYLAAADTLANWKRQMGYGVEIISASSWTSANVKTAIYNKYQNLSPKPDYFVILGDVQQVPAMTYTAPDASGIYGTDLYYACMDGGTDYVPEMAYGRISVSSSAEALMVVQKIINYERNPISDSSFYQNGVNCAQFQDDDTDGFADRRFTHTSEDVRDYVQARGYNVQRIYFTDNAVIPLKYNANYYSNGQNIPSDLLKSNNFDWTGGATDIKNAINAGKFYVLHRDHGYVGGSGWAHPYFVSGNVNQLSNGNKLPVVFSINCHTGEFTLNNCFAETFLRHSNGGAVGIFAASYYSYSGFNDGLTVGMFDGIWSNPGIVPVFGSGGNANPTVTAHSDIINMGFVLNHGLLRMTQTWGGALTDRIYSYRLFHYFGDPAMKMWTAKPVPITATYASGLNCTDTIFNITNCSDSLAVATLMFNGTLLGKADIINGSGSIYLPQVIGQTLTLTVTARNKIPLVAYVTVIASGGLSLTATMNHNMCFGDSSGIIRIIPSCGNPPYEISWADGSTDLFRDSLPGGDYIVTVTDSSNSSLTDTLTVWSPAAPLSSAPIITDAKCYFESSGSIILNLSGGAQPYDYQWISGSTGSVASNLAAGTHSVTVTDSAGCLFTQSFTISQPAPLDLNATYTDDLTNNCSGTGTAIVSGGTLPYAYSWNDPANQTTAIASGLCKGLYKVTVLDSNLCMQYRTIIISNTQGMELAEKATVFSIYPNPATDFIYLQKDKNPERKIRVDIYDILGQRIKSSNCQLIDNQFYKINISNLPSGIYWLIISNESSIIDSRKVVIERD